MRCFLMICFSFFFAVSAQASSLVVPDNETLVYTVRWNGVSLGEMRLTYWGPVSWKGREVIKVTSHSDTSRYKGIDTVYADPETFLPIEVNRQLIFHGKKEDIVEHYDQKHYVLRIDKKVDGEDQKPEIFQQKGPIQNSLLLYYLTRRKDAKIGDKFEVTLPKKEYEFSLDKISELKLSKGEEEKALVFSSDPSGFKVWISDTDDRIPLKMEMRKYYVIEVSMSFMERVYNWTPWTMD